MPWHFETAIVAAMFMEIGIWFRNVRLKRFRLYILSFMLVVGSVSVLVNSRVELNNNIIGNPALFLLGSLCLSMFVIEISKYINCRFLLFVGNSSMVFMGFNYFANTLFDFLVKFL